MNPLTPLATLMVIAKAPAPGRVKTRLCPPCTPHQAAGLAAAALADTLAAVGAVRAVRRVLVLDGPPADWIPHGFDVIAQRSGGLDDRLAGAFGDVLGATCAPALLIGMDTPQVTAELLTAGLELLERPGTDAVLGPAADGGWWAVGLHRGRADAFLGVPMSTSGTGRAQHDRLRSLGLTVAPLPTLVDIDDIATATSVAALIPDSRFARALAAMQPAEMLAARA